MAELHVFLDEAYGSADYYVGGIVVTDRQYCRLLAGLQEVRDHAAAKFGIPQNAELHGHRIMQGTGPWCCMAGQVHEAVALYKHALRVVVKSGALVFIEGVDVTRLRARYRYPDPPHDVAMRHVLERIDAYAMRRERTFDVVSDRVGCQEQVTRSVASYRKVGTPGFRSSKLSRMEGGLRWVTSEEETGVQAADLCVYIARRHKELTAQHPRARRAAGALWQLLHPAIHHDRKWLP